MTAFARETDDSGEGNLALEIRSVNHRYLDCFFKLPDALRSMEPHLRERLQGHLARGKIEIQFRWQEGQGAQHPISVDASRLAQLQQAVAAVAESVPQATPPNHLELLAWPGVVQSITSNTDTLQARALTLFDKALESLTATRQREGSKLAGFIRERLSNVHDIAADARSAMPQLLAQQKERLQRRLDDLAVEADPERIEQEIVLLSAKADVEEELDRLQAHVDEVGRVLDKGGPCGRRLDFLMQELNREANTLSSKSLATSTTRNAVDLKVLIEQMREQIQNIE